MASSQRLSVGVSMPPELVDEIDEYADNDGRSAFIRTAVREYMDADNDDE